MEFQTEAVEAVAKEICAADYVQGPHLTDPVAIEERWVMQPREMVEHYIVLALRAMRAFEALPEALRQAA